MVLLDVGVLALLMIVPLSSQHGVGAGVAQALGSLAIKWNTLAFWVAEGALAVGGIFLCSLLFRTRLIPRFLGGWGVIGYTIFLAGAIAEILGIHIGPINSVAVSPDCSLIASRGPDGAVILWEPKPDASRVTLRPDRRYEWTDITGLTGVSDELKMGIVH